VLLSRELNNSTLTRVGLSNLQPIASEDSFINMVLELNATPYRAVATSGNSERGEHIWRQSDDFDQASVVASDLVTADVWATVLIAGGAEAMELLPEGVAAMVVTKQREIRSTKGFYQLLGKL
jgi:thiamine biosynthesis lipoprotein ApbE